MFPVQTQFQIQIHFQTSCKGSEHERIDAGSGKRLIERTVPGGWSEGQYGDQQIGPEQLVWRGEDSIIFAKNVIDEGKGAFSYNKGPFAHLSLLYLFNSNEWMCVCSCDRCAQGHIRHLLSKSDNREDGEDSRFQPGRCEQT